MIVATLTGGLARAHCYLVAADGSTSSTDASLPLSPTTLEHSGGVRRLTAGVQVRL